jgi:hypothetical protein
MRIAIIVLLFGMLVASAVCLYLITRLEKAYDDVWGTDVSTATWRRKRWAFVLMMVAQLVGTVSVFFPPRGWIALFYVLMMFLFLMGYADSYRLLLADLNRLPRKSTTLNELSAQLDTITRQIEEGAEAARVVASDLSEAHARADAVSGSNHGAAADAAAQQTEKEKALDEEERVGGLE